MQIRDAKELDMDNDSEQGMDEAGNDSGTQASNASEQTAAIQWKPLTAKQRRVLGTLMEKSKTTPDAYPMTFAGLTTGCNQKTNRAPISNYSTEQVETIVDELRTLGAVTIVQGMGRVTKVRHYAYNWLAINKVEAAVMTELLLRGEQTLGELRTRASRMEPINDLNQMADLVQELKRRQLVVELSPPGRGQIFSHNLYPEWELEHVRKQVAAGVAAAVDVDEEPVSPRHASASPSAPVSSGASHVAHHVSPTSNAHSAAIDSRVQKMESELQQLRDLVVKLDSRLKHLESELGVTSE